MRTCPRWPLVNVLALVCFVFTAPANLSAAGDLTRIGDLVTVEGIRSNPLVGYGMVVGLNGTGDRRQTIFSTQTLANVLQRMGVQIPAAAVSVKNVASVFVTASLPPFARPGTQLDVTVSSTGDATSLEGGTLLLSPLYGANGQVYAEAQGPVALAGFAAGRGGNSKQVNHPTAGRIPNGGIVERDVSVDLQKMGEIFLLLRDADFGTSQNIVTAINADLGYPAASATDSRRVVVRPQNHDVPSLLARVLNLQVETHSRAKVVINERTGTIVMGKDVKIGAVSILHGNLTVEVSTEFQASQPAPFSNGTTVVLPQTTLDAHDEKARKLEIGEGASVELLVNGLQSMGASPRDVVAILEAIKAAGALKADLELI